MDTPITLEPSQLTQPETPIEETILDWIKPDEFLAFVRLVWAMANTIRHMNPSVVAAMTKFKAKYGTTLNQILEPC